MKENAPVKRRPKRPQPPPATVHQGATPERLAQALLQPIKPQKRELPVPGKKRTAQ